MVKILKIKLMKIVDIFTKNKKQENIKKFKEEKRRYDQSILKKVQLKNKKINILQIGAGSSNREIPPFENIENLNIFNFYRIEADDATVADQVKKSGRYFNVAISDKNGYEKLYV